jgi:transcription termination factor Rho
MYKIEELDMMLMSELRGLAKEFAIPEINDLSKQNLIYKILDKQAVLPPTTPKSSSSNTMQDDNRPERKVRKEVAPTSDAPRPKRARISKDESEASVAATNVVAEPAYIPEPTKTKSVSKSKVVEEVVAEEISYDFDEEPIVDFPIDIEEDFSVDTSFLTADDASVFPPGLRNRFIIKPFVNLMELLRMKVF